MIALAGIITFEFLSSFFGIYRSWRIVRIRREILQILATWILSSILLASFLYFIKLQQVVDNKDLLFWVFLTALSMIIFRIIQRFFLRYYRAYGFDHRTIAFIGATETALSLSEAIRRNPWMGLDIIGFFDDRVDSPDRPFSIPPEMNVCKIDAMIEMASTGKIDMVYITLPMQAEKRIKELIEILTFTAVSVFYVPSLLSFDLLHARWDTIDGQPIISIIDSPFEGSMGIVKRIEDIVLTLLALPIIAIPMLIISIIIKCTSKGPVIFKQSRAGLNGKEFKMLKFRTMRCCDDGKKQFVQATKNDSRITPFGFFLRRLSLDELPQFFNVLLGSMSVVGPRPHPIMFNEAHCKIVSRYMTRHKVKPGITGLAQTSGFRGETDSIEKTTGRIQCDLQYIRNWSLYMDLKILVNTVFQLFHDEAAY